MQRIDINRLARNNPSIIAAILQCIILLVCINTSSYAVPIDIARAPPFAGNNTAPNVMFTLDDSGSMQFEVLPDEQISSDIYYTFPTNSGYYGGDYYWCEHLSGASCLGGHEDNNEHHYMRRSYHNNKSYYNPTMTYRPWANSDGTIMANASITCAPHNPANIAAGCRNLTVQNNGDAGTSTDSYGRWHRRWFFGIYDWYEGKYINAQTGAAGFWPAVYFVFNAGNSGCDGTNTNRNCYDKIEIRPTITSYTGGANRSDCAGRPTCSYAEEIQNFANWYTYYRSRILSARAGVGQAFATQSSNIRVGFATINQGTKTVDGISSPGAIISGVRVFSGTDRADFFNQLYQQPIPAMGTPLRRALDDVGQYFSRTDDRGPWGEMPATGGGTQSACRQSYNIVTTDGYWNGSGASTSAARANVDNTNGPTISNPSGGSYQYVPVKPYSDSWGDPAPKDGTLSDIGMYYWNRDLHPSLSNEVPTTAGDPAYWQHLVNFTVGLGVFGTLNPEEDLDELISGNKSWPQPSDGDTGPNIDDLWHTAVNSRGAFFSVSDPDAFSQAISSTLNNISERIASVAAVALDTGSLKIGSKLYQARFDSSDWSGQILALPIASDGTLGTQVWEASTVLNAQDWDSGRKIITYKPSTKKGIAFRWPTTPSTPSSSEIDVAQSSILNNNPMTGVVDNKGNNRLQFLRGRTIAGFRSRSSKLGDILNSSPILVGPPLARYPDYWGTGMPESSSANHYSTFKSTYAQRRQILYVGANDGMLHAFDAGTYNTTSQSYSNGTGAELFAYVPNSVYNNLGKLTHTAYTHHNFVDGSANVSDALFGNAWHTVLVGGLRGGGQGIYALDVTDPPTTETALAQKVLWEFSDAQDADLGLTFSEPQVVRMANGVWAVVFGNGYNNTVADSATSSTGNAVLYIVNVETGALIKKIDTLIGSEDDPLGQNRPNGLATVAPVDVNGDFITDYVYAGDLFGNLWKFNLTNSLTSSWDSAYKSGSVPIPLFTAKAASGVVQPITTRPQVGRHPTESSQFMVYFGTGKYLGVSDNTPVGQTTQTYYGIRDKNDSTLTTITRSHLLQQKILREFAKTLGGYAYNLRVTSANPIDWDTHQGWYLDIFNTYGGNTNNYGERQVTDSILRNDRIVFTTLIPNSNPCGTGGDGWLMEIDAANGGRLEFSPFDLDRNNVFNQGDFVTIDSDGDGTDEVIPVSAKKSEVGIISTPGVISSEDGTKEYKYAGGSTGSIEITTENPGVIKTRRLSWRQIRY